MVTAGAAQLTRWLTTDGVPTWKARALAERRNVAMEDVRRDRVQEISSVISLRLDYGGLTRRQPAWGPRLHMALVAFA